MLEGKGKEKNVTGKYALNALPHKGDRPVIANF